MAFRWHYEDPTGAPVDGPGDRFDALFDDQDAAEEWLGENWPALLDAGVDRVTLLDGDSLVYGPMSLHPPQG